MPRPRLRSSKLLLCSPKVKTTAQPRQKSTFSHSGVDSSQRPARPKPIDLNIGTVESISVYLFGSRHQPNKVAGKVDQCRHSFRKWFHQRCLKFKWFRFEIVIAANCRFFSLPFCFVATFRSEREKTSDSFTSIEISRHFSGLWTDVGIFRCTEVSIANLEYS